MFALDSAPCKQPILNSGTTPGVADSLPLPLMPNNGFPLWAYEYFNQCPMPYFPMLFNHLANFNELIKNGCTGNNFGLPLPFMNNSFPFCNTPAKIEPDLFRINVDEEYYNQAYAK